VASAEDVVTAVEDDEFLPLPKPHPRSSCRMRILMSAQVAQVFGTHRMERVRHPGRVGTDRADRV
jgi:hypothetical protein